MILLYEVAAFSGKVPFLTDVIRKWPVGSRVLITAGIAFVFHDHFVTRRVF